MKALMMSKKMVLHIFSRHYLIFYGHLESLWSFFTPTANEKIRYLRLLCSIFVVVLPPLVYLLAETWHWAICTHKMIFSFFRCLVPFPPLKQLRRLSLPTSTVIDSSSSPLHSRVPCKTIYILLIQKYSHIFSQILKLDLKLYEVSDGLVSLHIVIHLLKKLMMGPLEYGGREEKKKIIDKQGPQRQSPKGITIPQDVSKMMRCTPFPSLLKKGSSQQCQKN